MSSKPLHASFKDGPESIEVAARKESQLDGADTSTLSLQRWATLRSWPATSVPRMSVGLQPVEALQRKLTSQAGSLRYTKISNVFASILVPIKLYASCFATLEPLCSCQSRLALGDSVPRRTALKLLLYLHGACDTMAYQCAPLCPRRTISRSDTAPHMMLGKSGSLDTLHRVPLREARYIR